MTEGIKYNQLPAGWSTILGIQGWEGNGNPLQCSCLENPMDRGPGGLYVVHGVAKSQTRLSDFIFTFHFHAREQTNHHKDVQGCEGEEICPFTFSSSVCGTCAVITSFAITTAPSLLFHKRKLSVTDTRIEVWPRTMIFFTFIFQPEISSLPKSNLIWNLNTGGEGDDRG